MVSTITGVSPLQETTPQSRWLARSSCEGCGGVWGDNEGDEDDWGGRGGVQLSKACHGRYMEVTCQSCHARPA